MTRLAAFIALLPLLAGGPETPPPPRDLDVIVSSGSPLDWLSDIPRPVPTIDRTSAKAGKNITVAEEAPHIRATDVFSFARITTVDLIGEIPWTVRHGQTMATGGYPPTVNDDILWLALSVFLRKILHPAQVNDLEAFEYLTYLGEPTLVAAGMAVNEPALKEVVGKLRKAVNEMPRESPPFDEGDDVLDTMMTRLAFEDMVCAHPFSFDQKFAGRISLLGDEAIPYVIKASKSSHSFLHRNAVVMLGRYDDPGCKARLREILQEDPDPCTRARAVDGLVRRRDSESVKIFQECLKKTRDRSFAVSLIRGLGMLGDAASVPAILAEYRQSPEFDTLVTTLTALARIGPKQSPEITALLKTAEDLDVKDPKPARDPVTPDPDGSRSNVLSQLVMLVQASQGDSDSVDRLVRLVRRAREQMDGEQKNDRRLYRGMLAEFNAQVIYCLLEVLARTRRGMDVLDEIAADRREDVVVRVHSLIEYAKVNREACADKLKSLIRLEEDQPVSETAFRLLASYTPLAATEVAKNLVSAYRPDLDQAQKSVLVLAIHHLATRKEMTLDRLIEIAEGELIRQETDKKPAPDPKDTRNNRNASKFEFNSPTPILEQVVIQIGHRGEREGMGILKDILGRASSPARGEAAIGLGVLRSPETFPALIRALEDSDPWVRFMAYRSLKFATDKNHPADWLFGTVESRKDAIEEYRKCIR